MVEIGVLGSEADLRIYGPSADRLGILEEPDWTAHTGPQQTLGWQRQFAHNSLCGVVDCLDAHTNLVVLSFILQLPSGLSGLECFLIFNFTFDLVIVIQSLYLGGHIMIVPEEGSVGGVDTQETVESRVEYCRVSGTVEAVMFAQLWGAGGVEGSEIVFLTVLITAAVGVTPSRALVTATVVGHGEMVAGLNTHHGWG